MTTDTRTDAAPRRRRHLMDPAHPVRPVDDHALTNVQRWVMSTLAVFTIAHLAAGLVVAALEVPESATTARVGLNVIAGAFGVLAVAAGRAIHRRSPLSPWLLVGLLPTAVGLGLAFG
ncbi:hypothetical protein [Nocardioides nitrophenolicus]|uniref:hypothetical protein n=1 Tax=Nocardioides nitrophenolicus TaxID=60489 RepID=UPI001958688C|nr:hypothetical protein [Nocardioides nitrophenolicus]MBM7518818.1 hypothetical protein [Nocardioides nitrophenolicus]